MSSYTQVKRLAVSRGKAALSKRVANNTYAERYVGSGTLEEPEHVGIRLHATTVVRFSHDGVELDTGGWRTVTTKARINDYLPPGLNLWSIKGEWVLAGYARDVPGHFSVPFADGIKLRVTRDFLYEPVEGTYPSPSQEALSREAKKKLIADIKAFIAKAAPALENWKTQLREQGSLNTAGDCFYCQGIVTDARTGGPATGIDHIWAHLREGYVFPSLFLQAYADKGFRNPRVVFASDLSYSHDHALDILRKYLVKVLGQSSEPTTNNASLELALEQAKEVLEKPGDFGYFGGDEQLWVSSAPTWTKHRDSSNDDVANFEVVWNALKEEFPALFPAELDDEGYPSRSFNEWPAIYVFGAGHWAVGHIDQIVVPVKVDPAKPLGVDNLHPAFLRVVEFGQAVKAYPLLEGAEEIVSRLDLEDAKREIRQYLDEPTDEQVEQLYQHLVDEHGEYPEYLETEQWAEAIAELGLQAQSWVLR